MIIDLDSHLREGYFMDEVYKLGEPFAQFTPRRANDEGRSHGTRFIHSLEPLNPQGLATHKHPYIYDPKVNWRAGEIAERQVGGYDMARRRPARSTTGWRTSSRATRTRSCRVPWPRRAARRRCRTR